MVPLNYHHLFYFWTVARSGSITAATQTLYLSQSTLSGQLKQFEAACGARLLERSRKGVSLTYEGRIVFERCERIFSEGEDLALLMRSGFKTPALLRLGVQPTISEEVVIRVLAFARKEDPSCRITLLSGEIAALQEKLKRQAVDLILSDEDCAPLLGRDYQSKLVGQLPVYLVSNRAVKRQVKSFPSDLEKTALLLRPPESPVRKQVDQFLRKRKLHCRVEAESNDVNLLRRLAMEGRGVAALSALTAAPDLKSGRLVPLHSAPIKIQEPIWFICGSQPRSSPALRTLVDNLMGRFLAAGPALSVQSLLDQQPL